MKDQEADRWGDRALRAFNIVDGQIQNGGLRSTLEYYGYEIPATIEGLRWFGLEESSGMLEAALALAPGAASRDEAERDLAVSWAEDDPRETRLDELQDAWYAADSAERIQTAYERKFAEEPAVFAAEVKNAGSDGDEV